MSQLSKQIAILTMAMTLLLFYIPTYAQDNTAPVITVPAQNISVSCNSTNVIGNLTNWYNNHAGAMATDNSGSVGFIAEPSFDDAILIFNASSDTLCGNTRGVRVNFIAVDGSGNQSIPTSARFSTFDNVNPIIINKPPDITVACGPNIRDSLINWIQNHGHAKANDICSDSVFWTSFVSNLPPLGSLPIDIGPYPNLPTNRCDLSINVTFFVEDDCGNKAATTGTFRIIDNQGPVLDSLPQDITISCDQIPEVPTINGFDDCYGEVFVNFSENSNQNPDSTICEHFNYDLLRIWTAQDLCGNVTTHVQNIAVRDLSGPILVVQNPLIVDCNDILINNLYNNIDTLFDDCSDSLFVTFVDNGVISGCQFSLLRIYTVEDICGNKTTEVQTLLIRDTIPPTITVEAKDSTFLCDVDMDYNLAFQGWLDNFAGSKSEDECSSIARFAAVPGSYDIENSSSFPGQNPGTFDTTACPSPLKGYIRYEIVDFLHIDECQNVSVTSAIFGVKDNNKPIITSCPSNRTFSLDQNECDIALKEIFPSATDNCTATSSPIRKKISKSITSSQPGNPEIVVDTVVMKIGPFNSSTFDPLSAPEFKFEMQNLDADDATEYFTIFNEDGINIGQTPIITQQCGDTIFYINNQSLADLKRWLSDGFITFTFAPNMPASSGVLGINAVCNGSRLIGEAIIEINPINVLSTSYRVNNGSPISGSIGDTVNLNVSVGINTIEYIFVDCAGNQSTCIQSITLNDLFPPILSCGDTLTYFTSLDSCDLDLNIPLDLTIDENCKLSEVYNQVLPSSAEGQLMIFNYDSINMRHLATNRLFTFDNVKRMKYGKNVELRIEINGDINDTGETFQILGEGGLNLGRTSVVPGTGCKTTVFSISIPRAAFNQWANDNKITIIAIAPVGLIEGGGINPCEVISPSMTVDGVSTIKANLIYHDADITYKFNNDTSTYHVPIGSDSIQVSLTQGINNITYTVTDLGGNKATCGKTINLIDNQIPKAKCKDGIVEIHPSGLISAIVEPDSINNGSSDNCGIMSFTIISDTLGCGDVGSNSIVQLIVEDAANNKDTCIANVTVNNYTVKPSFTAGICAEDTLKLFTNLPSGPPGANYTFQWYRNDTIFSTEENPALSNANNTLSGLYKVIVTGFGGCVSEGIIDVNIVPLTKPNITSDKISICNGDAIVLSASIFSGTVVYSWYSGSSPNGTLLGTSASGKFAVTPSQGMSTYYVVANNTDCETPPSDSIFIEINTKPIPSVDTSFITACEGELINLAATNSNPDYTYDWTGPNNYKSSLKTPTPFSSQSSSQGDYKLVVSIGSCNSDTAIVSITSLVKPNTPNISGELIYCKGSTFSLAVNNVTNGTTYMWYKNGLLFRTTQDNNLDVPNAQTDLTGDWTVVVVRDGCMSLASQVLSITVDDLINVGADNSGPVCFGDSVVLNSTFVPNATYQWSGPNNFLAIGQSVKAPSIGGDYSVTITTPTNCSNTASTEVEVNIPPSITALSTDNPGCINQNSILNFSPTIFPLGQYTYQWTGPNGYTNNTQNPTITNLSFSDTGRYTLVVFSDDCPSNPKSINISFGISPQTPLISGPLELCQGDALQLITAQNAATYQWITPTGVFPIASNNYNIASVSNSNTGDYKLVLFNGICASDTSNTISLDVKPIPIAPIISGDNDICYNSKFELFTNIVGAETYTWTLPNNTTESNDSIIILNANSNNEGTYQLNYTQDGCLSFTSDMFFLNVRDSIPTPSFLDKTLSVCTDLTEAIEICLDPNLLSAGTTYNLINLANGATISTTTGLCFTITDPTLLATGSNELVVVGEKDGCKSKVSKSVIVIFQSPPSLIAMATDNLIIACESEDFISLTANNGPPEVDIEWTALTPGIVIGNPNSKSTLANGFLTGENLIKLSYSKAGCNNFSSDTVRIFLEPAPTINNDEKTILFNTSSVIDIFSNDIIPINSSITIDDINLGTLTQNGNTYTFTPDIGTVGTTTFTYEVCVDGCPDLCQTGIVTLNIGLNTECILPSIITPNNDGINDNLIIPCLSTNKFNTNRIFVFNEWGDEVFYAKPYENNWDGSYGGDPLPVGTYFIVFEPGNGASPIRGFLTLQR